MEAAAEKLHDRYQIAAAAFACVLCSTEIMQRLSINTEACCSVLGGCAVRCACVAAGIKARLLFR